MNLIWKATITVLCPWNPENESIENIVYEAMRGDSICVSKVTNLADPDEIALAGDFFGEAPDEEGGKNPCLEVSLGPPWRKKEDSEV